MKNVRCRVTGKEYDPEVEFEKFMKEPWIIELLKRLKYK